MRRDHIAIVGLSAEPKDFMTEFKAYPEENDRPGYRVVITWANAGEEIRRQVCGAEVKALRNACDTGAVFQGDKIVGKMMP